MPKKLNGQAALKPTALSENSIFGPAPILEGENEQAYGELLAQVSNAVNPSDMIERIWVRDIVDLTWDILRWRRVKTRFLAQAALNLLTEKLTYALREQVDYDESNAQEMDFYTSSTAGKLSEKWSASDSAATKKVEKLLRTQNLTIDDVVAEALMDQIDGIERVDHLTTVAEGRRIAVLREIDRHRVAFSQELRGAVREIDAEYERVEPKGISHNKTTNMNTA
jgi:hypothetical protein